MLINASVTVWHYDEDTEEYTRTVAESVHWYETDGTEDEKGGFLPAKKVIVRFFKNAPVSCGDLVRKGVFNGEKPEKSACFAVMSITDNREARLLPHVKAVCV